MKLFSISGAANNPCYVLKFKDTHIMLDCGLDFNTMLHFMPVFNVQSSDSNRLGTLCTTGSRTENDTAIPCDIHECNGRFFFNSEPLVGAPEIDTVNPGKIDAILISNYLSILALPYITEGTGFVGTIYATEPSIQSGRHLMEELVAHLTDSSIRHPSLTTLDGSQSGIPLELLNALKGNTRWRAIYTQSSINACLAKVHPIAYNEKNSVYGLLRIMAISSGYCIGSCNWIIDSDHERVTYVAGSSTLTTHPRPMEHTSLKGSDVMIVTNLTRSPMHNPDAMIREFCVAAAVTVKKGGNVLIPCLPCGVIFDMFECLASHLKTCHLQHIPMYFVSPRADASLAYSNIYAEWLTSSKMANVYLPEPPFYHAELLRTGRLKAFQNIHNEEFNDTYRTPCVIFTGHPSLRCGDITHFIRLFSPDKNNTIIFTDPDVNYLDAIAPYQPLQMRVAFFPIDTRLSFAQVNKLIRDLKPKHLVIPEEYTQPPIYHPGRLDLVIDAQNSNSITHKALDVIDIPVKRQYETVQMDAKLAADLVPTELKPGVAVVQVAALLKNNDNRFTIEPIGNDFPRTKKKKLQRPILYGNLNISEFTRRLEENGISDVKVEDIGGGNYMVDLPTHDSLIQIEPGSIHIVCNEESVRVKIRDATLQSLQKIVAAK